ncbi:MAG: DUF2723 domain-containing protein [Ignavibacteria bacterium]|nr:DUF2723 domain-containing protein [Ignavibacteria bacterium]
MTREKMIKYFFGILAFLITLIVYTLTVQPSVPLWDCGEFSAATIWQQVPHPPGAPLFLMIGKVFHILLPFGDPGWSVNMVSVFSTAFFVFLLYLIIIKVIQNFRGKELNKLSDELMVYGSAFVGAMAFAFCDTVWFNGVESEVYAMSQLFTTLVVYFMMLWNEKADEPGSEKYLLIMFYLIGLSIGVHLLAILTIFSIFLTVYFRKYEFSIKSFIVMTVLAVISFFVVYKVILMWIPGLLAGNFPIKTEAREYPLENNFLMTLLGILLIFGGVAYYIWAAKRKKPLLQLVLASYLLIFFGFTTYTHILIRSNANPPMNENEPKNLKKLIAYLGREQYGEQVLWPRRTDYNDELKIYYYNLKDENGNYVYGEWNPPGTKEVMRKDGTIISVPIWDNVNFAGELAYLWKYQIDHMYLRYFFWNFVGRESDVQDAQEAWFADGSQPINYKNGYADKFPIKFFALPLLFGILGLYYHFKRDPKMGFVFLAMFLFMGVLAAIAQNQQNPQPRERDYFYTGSFMVWCLWIGLGTYYLIELVNKKKETTILTALALIISILLVPFNMLIGGWKTHTRANNYFPFDYSYNILQSLEKDAIVFTNGDNDTFPLWFLQDVAGVRRDVRIVNLSLGQTLWYIDQLKNREPWGAKKIPLSFTDEQLHTTEDDPKALSYEFGEAKEIKIPVKKEILAQYTDDTSLINKGYMEFTFVGKKYTERNGKPIYIFFVNNKLILDILQQTRFERPVYFSTTCGSDVFSGLGRHLRMEGMAWRVCPVPQNSLKTGMMDEEIMDKCLLQIDNSNNFFKEPRNGFKLRNLDGKGKYVYYDEVHRRMIQSYRQIYMNYAGFLIEQKKDKQKAARVLDTMNKYISPKLFPMYYDEEYQMSLIYKEAGEMDKAKFWATNAIKTCKEIIDNPKLRRFRYDDIREEIRGRTGPYKVASASYALLGDYTSARNSLLKLYDLVFTAIQTRQIENMEIDENSVRNNLYDILGNIMYLDEQQVNELIKSNRKEEAQKLADSLIASYKKGNDPLMQSFASTVETKLKSLISGKEIIDTVTGN